MEHSSEYFIYSYIYIIYTPPFPFPVLTWARPSCYLPCHLGSQQICTTGGVCPHSTKIFPEFPLNGFSLTPTPNRLSLQTLIQTLPVSEPHFPPKSSVVTNLYALISHFFILSVLRAESVPSLTICATVPQVSCMLQACSSQFRCSAGVLGRGFSHHMSGGTRWSSECLPLPSWTILKPYQKGQLASSLLFSSLVKNKYEPFLQGLIIF